MVDVLPSGTIAVGNGLGECVLWDDEAGQLLWTDIPGHRLYTHDPSTGTTEYVEFDEDLCSFGFIAGRRDLVCAFQSGIANVARDGRVGNWRYRLPEADRVRLNDGRVDRQGRFWVGSMMANEGNRTTNGVSGELFCLDAAGDVRGHLRGIRISNSICWSPEGDVMYFGDSPRRQIYAFDFDAESGTLSNRRVFAHTPLGTVPDGSTVDAEGFLWNAEWGNGRVVRYAPDGTVDSVVQLPVSHLTCVAFGGPDLSTLYVTTARYGLSEDALLAEAQAGDVFAFSTSVRGLPEVRYRDAAGTAESASPAAAGTIPVAASTKANERQGQRT